MTSTDNKFQRKSPAEIIRLLKDKDTNNCSTAAFCTQHGISHQTFYNWQKKYGAQPSSGNNFIALPVAHIDNIQPTPFCEISISGKATIRFFDSIDAKYLKSLIS
jgi:hypothetical protein